MDQNFLKISTQIFRKKNNFWNFSFFYYGICSRIIYNLGCNAPGMGTRGRKHSDIHHDELPFNPFRGHFNPLSVISSFRSLDRSYQPHSSSPPMSHRYKQTQRYKHIYGQALIKLATRPKPIRNVPFEEFFYTKVTKSYECYTNSDG